MIDTRGQQLHSDRRPQHHLTNSRPAGKQTDHSDDDREGECPREPEAAVERDRMQTACRCPEGESTKEPAGDEAGDCEQECSDFQLAIGRNRFHFHSDTLEHRAFEERIDDAVKDFGMTAAGHEGDCGNGDRPKETADLRVIGGDAFGDVGDCDHADETAADHIKGIFQEGGNGTDDGRHAEAAGSFDPHEQQGDLARNVFAHLAEGIGSDERDRGRAIAHLPCQPAPGDGARQHRTGEAEDREQPAAPVEGIPVQLDMRLAGIE